MLDDDAISFYFVVAGVFALAGFVKGVIGLGLPTVVMGLLGTILLPAQAAALMIIPAIATNIWQIAAGPAFLRLLRRLWLMLAGICVGTWIAADFLINGNAEQTRFALGVVLLLYGCTGFTRFQWRVPPRAEQPIAAGVGVTTGLFNGASGVFVFPAAPYVQSLGLNREELIQALAMAPTAAVLALSVNLISSGVLESKMSGISILAMIPAFAGMYLGQWVRLRTSELTFRRIFFAWLIALGGYLALRNF
jgi:hypothetical protein